jgi:hypothetical protein
MISFKKMKYAAKNIFFVAAISLMYYIATYKKTMEIGVSHRYFQFYSIKP